MSAQRVVVAMSGGVDSSVAAALLQDQGFEVIGITMQIWDGAQDVGGCCGLASIDDAKRVAEKLAIPHYVLNFRDVFREKVIADFCNEYQQGRTPNPCIRCNQYIKFEHLLKRAQQLDAAYIATGHYARIEFDGRRKRYLLKKGLDTQKDQSYVLYTMTQEQLKYTLLPLGELTKQKVRRIAKEKKLAVADKPDSQEICFVPDNDYGRFLKEYNSVETKPGPIVNTEGKVIGEHKGITHYTIGQRKGLGIADKQPLYVTAINKEENTIVAGKKEQAFRQELLAEDLNLIALGELNGSLKGQVQVRYKHPAAAAVILPQKENKVLIKFEQPQFAVTPGQAAVFYQDDIVLGGGTIATK
ncbi:MAG: tRNA 2-thiouridine(34) synthase MnmA [Candidatus Omnitrophica bacterium]|nr:tRNA 2-thiouridine(34) synthase MnmA [Candidatus Omnitrophota bacterium]